MFGSIVLDIVLGLVLIYLLYSLLITIVGEMISNWFGLRARILRSGIEGMLNNESESSLLAKGTKEFFLYESSDFKNSFAGKFYSCPSIKQLAQSQKSIIFSFRGGKPSYISKENFSGTLVFLLKKYGEGLNEMDKIKFCLTYNTLHVSLPTLSHMKDLFESSNGESDRFKEKLEEWFDNTMDRINGWYKRKMQFILFWFGFLISVVFNLNSISISKLLANDKDARNQMVHLAIELNKDSLRYAQFVNSNDTILSDAILDSSLTHINRDIFDARKLLGLGWNFTKHAGKIEIPSNDSMIADSFELVKRNLQRDHDDLNDDKTSLALFSEILDSLAIEEKYSTDLKQLDTLKNAIKLNKDKVLFVKKKILIKSKTISRESGQLAKIERKLSRQSKQIFSSIDSVSFNLNSGTLSILGYLKPTLFEKVCFICKSALNPFRSSFWGFVITALALSLGAPFWFDLLRKLVAIRSAGVKPEEKTLPPLEPLEAKPSVTTTLRPNTFQNQIIDLFEEALNTFTSRIKNEIGIAMISLEPQGKNASQSIVVHVENQSQINYLNSLYGNTVPLKDGTVLPIVYLTSAAINVHVGMCGGGIGNKQRPNDSGTLGCYLKKKGDDKNYMLSCWHVMKDNEKWDLAIVEREIMDSTNSVIGSVVHGCITDKIDIGIAECNAVNNISNSGLPIKSQQREITAYDALVNTSVTIFGSVSGKRKANIIQHKINAFLKYPGEMEKRVLLDTFSIAMIDSGGRFQSPTQPGDSGAIVIDDSFTPIGMIIGGDGYKSYAIKFTNIFNEDKIYNQFSFVLT